MIESLLILPLAFFVFFGISAIVWELILYCDYVELSTIVMLALLTSALLTFFCYRISMEFK